MTDSDPGYDMFEGIKVNAGDYGIKVYHNRAGSPD